MTISTNTTSNQQYKSPSLLATGTGIGVGYAVNKITQDKLARMVTKPIREYGCKVSHDEHSNKLIREIADNILKVTGLESKGIRIEDYSESYLQIKPEILEQLQKERKQIIKENLFHPIRLRNQLKNIDSKINGCKRKLEFVNGTNAAFTKTAIHVNMQNNAIAMLHEIGHGINAFFDKNWSAIQRSRVYTNKLKIAVPVIALLIPKKTNGEKPKNFLEKSGAFIRNNVGVLTFLTMAPVIAEEFKASQRGNKIALDAFGNGRTYKNVVLSNRIAGVTYIVGAALFGVAAWASVKIKDIIARPKLIKEID